MGLLFQKLHPPTEFPQTTRNETEKYYDWHHDPDLLSLLLKIQPHYESAIKCKTDKAALSYRPHVNKKYFGSWIQWKMLNDAMQRLRQQANEEPFKARDAVKEIREREEGDARRGGRPCFINF